MKKNKEKKLLERIERIRSRMLCHELSLALMGRSYDFDLRKASELTDNPASPVSTGTTFMSWWSGVQKIRGDSLEKADQTVPGISRWFNLEHIGSPMQRHLGAIYTLSREFGEGDCIHQKCKRIEDGVASAQAIWSTFWAVDQCPRSGPLSMVWQLEKMGKKLSEPTYRYADGLSKVRAEAGLINAHAFEVSNGARASYASQNESGLFRFLLALIFEPEVEDQQWWPILVLDIGAAAAHCRARMSVDERDPYTVYGAQDLKWVFIISRVLWGNEKTCIECLLANAESVDEEIGAQRFVRQLLMMRNTYQSLVKEWGGDYEELSIVAKADTDYVADAAERKG